MDDLIHLLARGKTYCELRNPILIHKFRSKLKFTKKISEVTCKVCKDYSVIHLVGRGNCCGGKHAIVSPDPEKVTCVSCLDYYQVNFVDFKKKPNMYVDKKHKLRSATKTYCDRNYTEGKFLVVELAEDVTCIKCYRKYQQKLLKEHK